MLIAHLIGRAIVVALGFFLALAAASVAAVIALDRFGLFGTSPVAVERLIRLAVDLFDYMTAGGGFRDLVRMTVGPFLVFAIVAEVFRIRSFVLHVVAGGVIAAVVLGQSRLGATLPVGELILATGITGGLVYWIVAGSSAGLWRSRSPAERAPPPPVPVPVPAPMPAPSAASVWGPPPAPPTAPSGTVPPPLPSGPPANPPAAEAVARAGRSAAAVAASATGLADSAAARRPTVVLTRPLQPVVERLKR
jgi:hypothetical protein